MMVWTKAMALGVGRSGQTQHLFWRQMTGRANGFGMAWQKERNQGDSNVLVLAAGKNRGGGRLAWRGGTWNSGWGLLSLSCDQIPRCDQMEVLS